MKKIITLSIIAVCLCCTVTNGQATMSVAAKKNLATNTAIMQAYNSGDFSKMSDYIAADAIDHGGDNGDVKGIENIVKEMKRYREMMTDMKYRVVKELADDEYVFSWSKVNGNMKGKPTTMTGMDVTRFNNGKAVEHWVFMDPNEMMAMMMTPATKPAAPVAPGAAETAKPQ